jgi:peptidyl-prolyl cis-trans isomerase A (cyclophilin A)
MVRVVNQRRRNEKRSRIWLFTTVGVVILLVVMMGMEFLYPKQVALLEERAELDLKLLQDATERNIRVDGKKKESEAMQKSFLKSVDSNAKSVTSIHPSCPYTALNDLTALERYPVAGSDRHMVTPPQGGNVTLVCCHTTVGPWNILVHHKWAPIGAQRFLDMVQSGYFDTGVPLMRCVADFLCQFGLNGNPTAMKPFQATLPDDPNWLPEGPTHRKDPVTGVRRFNRGYLAYAGAGPCSRDLQFIVALQDNGPLAGGSPWEVPWGELVGAHSYETLSRIYTGYGEKGPSQGLLHRANALEVVKEKYPLIDYVNSCHVVDRYGEEETKSA